MTKTIVLVHGAWLNSTAWERWKPRYEKRGYTVVTPDWPGDEGDPVELKAHPRQELTKYGPKEIVAHYERIIRALPESTIIMGHVAASYLSSAVESVVSHNMADVLMEGVRLLGASVVAFIQAGAPEDSVSLLDKILARHPYEVRRAFLREIADVLAP